MSKLHEIYIKKYVSCKDYNIVLKNALSDFENIYNPSTESIVTRDIDFILFLMNKNEFIGLIRHTIIGYNNLHPIKLHFNDKYKLLSKKEIIQKYSTYSKDFIFFLTASLYSYI